MPIPSRMTSTRPAVSSPGQAGPDRPELPAAATSTRRPARATSLGAELPLLAGWASIGLGTSLGHGRYSIDALFLVTVGTSLLVVTAAGRLSPVGEWGRVASVGAGAAVLGGFHDAAGIYGSGTALTVSHVLTSRAAVAVAAWLVLDLPRRQLVAYGTIATMAAAGVAMVLSSPRPAIDVWYMLQAAGHGLSHGQSIYTTQWSTGIGYEQSNGFAYLPGSAVLLWPFQVIFGDVRYGLLTAMAVTAVLMARARSHSKGVLLCALVMLYPLTMFGLEQSWVDPLVLMTVCAATYAVVRGRHGWAVVALALCLVCKQQAWLILPLACFWRDFGWRRAALSAGGAITFMLPWIVTAPHAFYSGVITYNLDLPARLDSLSLFTSAVRAGWSPGIGVVSAATLGALALVVWRVPRDTYGFLLGSAAVMAVFNLTNKQSFFNEWSLAAGLALAALVFGPVVVRDSRQPWSTSAALATSAVVAPRTDQDALLKS